MIPFHTQTGGVTLQAQQPDVNSSASQGSGPGARVARGVAHRLHVSSIDSASGDGRGQLSSTKPKVTDSNPVGRRCADELGGAKHRSGRLRRPGRRSGTGHGTTPLTS